MKVSTIVPTIFHKYFLVPALLGVSLLTHYQSVYSAQPTQLSDFVIYSGNLSDIGGHNLINGNVGGNGDVSVTGNTQLYGGVYVINDFTLGSNSAIGSDGITLGPNLQSSTRFPSPVVYPALLSQVIVNNQAHFNGGSNIFGNVSADDVFLGTNTIVKKVSGSGGNVVYTTNYTTQSGAGQEGTASTPFTTPFIPIALPTPTQFTAGGVDQTVPGSNFLNLAPGTYGSLSTSAQNQTVQLRSGNYYFDTINAQGGFTLQIDLTSGNAINIYSVGDISFGQNTILEVKGAGTGGNYVPISSADILAGLVNWETKGEFTLGGGMNNTWTTIFGGTLFSSRTSGLGVDIGQRVDWYGAIYADEIDLADHSRYNHIAATIPEPSTYLLMGGMLLLLFVIRRRNVLPRNVE